jgi:nicotinate-nucleotide pyrophosphorylase (carboxylating)
MISMHNDYFSDLDQNIKLALSEDVGDVDITALLIDANTSANADVITRDQAVICGVDWVNEVFKQVDPSLQITWHVKDTDLVEPNQKLFSVSGNARSILTGERPALNFLQTLSGTATVTHRYASLIAHTHTKLLDTRKTLPGLRRAQKYAVKCGGGENHRIGLYDAFLIKENHIMACGSIAKAIGRAKSLHPDRRIEIEVENLSELTEAINAEPNWIMIDNFSLDDMRTAVEASNDSLKLEASGGIESDEDLIAIAETGVDYISVGALTKHVRATDLSMRMVN